MEKIHFNTRINAPKEKVWKVLWDDDSYRQWTTAFSEGSYAVTDNWRQGTEVKFLGPSGEGMISRVAENRPNEFMSFEHLGMIMGGVEDRSSDKVKAWAGARENYTLKENDGATDLEIDMDISAEYKDMFMKMWPPALEKVKTLSESE